MLAKVAYLRPRAGAADTEVQQRPQAGASAAALSRFSQLVSAIYEGPSERPPWRSALQLLKEQLQVAHAILILRAPTADHGGVIVNSETDDLAARKSYDQHFFAVDPFVGLKEGDVVTPEELLGERWLDTAIYKEYLSPLGIRYILGADFHTTEGVECRLRITRSHGAKRFSEDDKAYCRLVLPHFKQAIRLHTRIDSLECERQVFSDAVDRLLLGVVRLGRNGDVIDMNEEAKRILGARDGISCSGARLCLENQHERRELQRLINQCLDEKPAGVTPGLIDAMAVTRPSGASRLALIVKPIPSKEWAESRRRPVATVFIRDPDSPTVLPSHELVRQMFGFTRVESSLAILLSDGHTLDEASELMNIRRNTARTHLRAIFCKTGVTRQTMLVRMMLRSVFSLS